MKAIFIRCDNCHSWLQWNDEEVMNQSGFILSAGYRCDGCPRVLKTHNDKPFEVKENAGKELNRRGVF